MTPTTMSTIDRPATRIEHIEFTRGIDELTSSDGVKLALHYWRSHRPRARLFYVHGMQSHAGWLYETGPQLATQGIDVYVLDRRGSGSSEGQRGHVDSKEQLLEDYARAIAHAGFDDRHPLVLLGQSLGGNILAALLTERSPRYDGVVFCAPALGQVRAKNSSAAVTRIRELSSRAQLRINLTDADYTSIPVYLEFMAQDRLMLRTLSESSQRVFLEIEDTYVQTTPRWRHVPIGFARPATDNVIRLPEAESHLRRICGDRLETKIFDTTDHYLEFSQCRRQYLDWLSNFVLRLKNEKTPT